MRAALAWGLGPRGSSGERGSAVVEFSFLAVLLLAPLVYLVVTLGRLQAASYAVTQAAREAGRAFVTTPDHGDPIGRALAAAELAYSDQGFAGLGQITMTCHADPCLSPEAEVTAQASVSVSLPLAPLLADLMPARIPVSATYVASVERFR